MLEAFAIWLVGAWCGGLVGYFVRQAIEGAKRVDEIIEAEVPPGDFAEARRRVL